MKQTSLQGIANRAASDKAHRFQNLFGMLNVGFLLWCWQFVNKRAVSGVDRKDARSYQENLRENIEGTRSQGIDQESLRAMESEARARSPRIWSPPVLQGSVVRVTGTGLLPYIRPVDEGQRPFWPR
jgi:hypothetical protein